MFQLINLFVIAAAYPNPGPNALSVTALSTSYTPNPLVNSPYQFYQVEPHMLLVLRKETWYCGHPSDKWMLADQFTRPFVILMLFPSHQVPVHRVKVMIQIPKF